MTGTLDDAGLLARSVIWWMGFLGWWATGRVYAFNEARRAGGRGVASAETSGIIDAGILRPLTRSVI